MTELSVVVPVYNEEENIALLAEKLHAALSRLRRTYEVVLIDDGSSDGSWERLREAAGRYPCFKLIRFRRNFGQTAAMSAGFNESSGQVIVTLDADLQNDPEDIPKILAKVDEGCDVVTAGERTARTLSSRGACPPCSPTP